MSSHKHCFSSLSHLFYFSSVLLPLLFFPLFSLLPFHPFSFSFPSGFISFFFLSPPHSVPPIVVPLTPGQQVIGNETESATLSFRIDNAAPSVLLEGLRWFYTPDLSINDPFAGQEITNFMNRTTESTLTFSDFTGMQYINLTVSNIVQQRLGIDGETDEGRYFLVATNPAGETFSYIDLLVYGEYIVTKLAAL